MPNQTNINIHPEIILMIACSIISVLLIWSDCSSHNARGYIATVCENGIGIFDILALIFLSPLYLIFLLVNNFVFGGFAGVKLW